MNDDKSKQFEKLVFVNRILFASFLETAPPGKSTNISDLFETISVNLKSISRPDIQLNCDSDTCQGMRYFMCRSERQYISKKEELCFLTYACRNCQTQQKIFAIYLLVSEGRNLYGSAIKIGEFPVFGSLIPSRVISLIGPDREIFIRGRRAENQGLGIGAFAYYRRVVENQKGRLITEIAKVAKRLGGTSEDIKRFQIAAKETQFSKAIDDIKGVIPQVLLINGHNPLTLLHSALSEGLHAGTDEACLELATTIRVVLTELAERISQALKDETELRNAISKLLKPSADNNPETK